MWVLVYSPVYILPIMMWYGALSLWQLYLNYALHLKAENYFPLNNLIIVNYDVAYLTVAYCIHN